MTDDRLEPQEWKEIVESLENIVRYYDKMSDLTTFFQVEHWRRAAAEFSGEDFDVLEIGCGPGSFTRHLRGRRIVCIDPSREFLKVTRKRVNGHYEFHEGIAEDIPLDNDSFDRVFCSFSFRDFMNKRRGLEEISRVLRPGGVSVILEIAKRDSEFWLTLMKLHLKYVVPLVASIAIPRRERRSWSSNPYSTLWSTYEQFDTIQNYAALMKEIGFEDVHSRLLSFGGAFLLWGEKG